MRNVGWAALSALFMAAVAPLAAADQRTAEQEQTASGDRDFLWWCTNQRDQANVQDLLWAAASELGKSPAATKTVSCQEAFAVLKNLTKIEVSGEFVDANSMVTEMSLEPLRGLRKLRELTIRDAGNQDLSFLHEFPDLKNLRIWDVQNLSGLAKLSNLSIENLSVSLGFSDNRQPIDMRYLVGLPRLRSLTLLVKYGEARASNETALMNFALLEDLSLHNFRVDLQNFGVMPQIRELKLSYPSTLDGIEHFPNLEALSYSAPFYTEEAQNPNLIPLTKLKKLSSIHLDGWKKVSFDPLQQVAGLKHLGLVWTRLENLPDERLLAKLTTLHLTQNGITDITRIPAAKILTTLDISNNPVEDLSPLARLPSLKKLAAERTKVDKNDSRTCPRDVPNHPLTAFCSGTTARPKPTGIPFVDACESSDDSHWGGLWGLVDEVVPELYQAGASCRELWDAIQARHTIRVRYYNEACLLAPHRRLTKLTVAENVSDFNCFKDLPNLITLRACEYQDLSRCAPLKNLPELPQLENLEYYDFDEPHDVSGLQSLKNLKRLTLQPYGQPYGKEQPLNLRQFSHLRKLESLDLGWFHFIDMSEGLVPLSEMKSLKSLRIDRMKDFDKHDPKICPAKIESPALQRFCQSVERKKSLIQSTQSHFQKVSE